MVRSEDKGWRRAKVTKKIHSINEFANMCGYFFNACIEQNFICNNGYNCNHPEQKEADVNEEAGTKVGRCYAWSCPLAYEADEEDFQDPEIDNQDFEYEECEYVVVDMEKFGGDTP
jgi:hypothetical protein